MAKRVIINPDVDGEIEVAVNQAGVIKTLVKFDGVNARIAADTIVGLTGSAPVFPNGAAGVGGGGTFISPVTYRLAKQAVGAVGSSGQVRAGHLFGASSVAAKSHPALIASNSRVSCDLNVDGTDVFGNGSFTAQGGGLTFPATGGLQNDGRSLASDTTDWFENSAGFYDAQTTNNIYAAVWMRLSNWVPGAATAVMGVGEGATTDRVWDVNIASNGDVTFSGTSDGATFDTNITIPNPGFAADSWHHFAFVHSIDQDLMLAYIDGALVGTAVKATLRASSSNRMRLGNSSGGNSIAGQSFRGFAYGKSATYTATAEDIRRLYAYRIDHAANVAVEYQEWTANLYSSAATQDDQAWLVDKVDANSTFVDFSGLAATDSVDLCLKNTGLNAVAVNAYPPFDQTYTSNPTFPLAHGQQDIPDILLMQEVSTGVWEMVSATGHVNMDLTNITGSLAAFFTGGALKVRVIARAKVANTGVAMATGTQAGIVKSFASDPSISVLSTSANTTLLTGDGYEMVMCTTGAGGITVTLPAAASNTGRKLWFKKIDSGAGALTIDGNAAELIDGSTTAVINTQRAFMCIVSIGTSWQIIG